MLQYDPLMAAETLCRVDRRLARVIERVGLVALPEVSAQKPFETLLRAIVYQQLSGKAAATIFGRVKALYPRGAVRPGAILATPDDKLRACGLSANKTLAVKDLSTKTLARLVPSLARLKTMDDDEIVSRLTQVRGIGVWTVEMLLIFRLGRPDVLPIGDLGVRKGLMLAYRMPAMPTPGELLAIGEKWRPYRSAASWYLWRATELLAKTSAKPK